MHSCTANFPSTTKRKQTTPRRSSPEPTFFTPTSELTSNPPSTPPRSTRDPSEEPPTAPRSSRFFTTPRTRSQKPSLLPGLTFERKPKPEPEPEPEFEEPPRKTPPTTPSRATSPSNFAIENPQVLPSILENSSDEEHFHQLPQNPLEGEDFYNKEGQHIVFTEDTLAYPEIPGHSTQEPVHPEPEPMSTTTTKTQTRTGKQRQQSTATPSEEPQPGNSQGTETRRLASYIWEPSSDILTPNPNPPPARDNPREARNQPPAAPSDTEPPRPSRPPSRAPSNSGPPKRTPTSSSSSSSGSGRKRFFKDIPPPDPVLEKPPSITTLVPLPELPQLRKCP